MGRFGLTCDNILEATVVSDGASQRVREHSRDMWLLRGAGAAMGFISDLTLRVHEIESWFRRTSSSTEDVIGATRQFENAVGHLPDQVGSAFTLTGTPEGRVTAVIDAVAPARDRLALAWCGDVAPGGSNSEISMMTYSGVQRALDSQYQFGGRSYRRSVCVSRLEELNMLALIAEFATRGPFTRTLTVDVLHGAALDTTNRVQSCFPRFMYTALIVCQWASSDLDEAGRAAGRALSDLARPSNVAPTNRAVYGNYSSEADDALPAGALPLLQAGHEARS
jgi:hypothetical protein